jgi:biopolymer transport protein ExbD
MLFWIGNIEFGIDGFFIDRPSTTECAVSQRQESIIPLVGVVFVVFYFFLIWSGVFLDAKKYQLSPKKN